MFQKCPPGDPERRIQQANAFIVAKNRLPNQLFKSHSENMHVSVENSATGTRTRVARVRAEYPNQLDYSGSEARRSILDLNANEINNRNQRVSPCSSAHLCHAVSTVKTCLTSCHTCVSNSVFPGMVYKRLPLLAFFHDHVPPILTRRMHSIHNP